MHEIFGINFKEENLGVIADIHGQINALKAAINCFHHLGVNQFIFLGDAINYRPFGNQCTNLLRNSSELLVGVKGNHDTNYSREYYQDKQWQLVTKENLDWLNSLHDLALIHSNMKFLMVHDFYDVSNKGAFLRSLNLIAVLVGHFHYPSIYFWNKIRVITIGGIVYGYFGIISFSDKEIIIFQLHKKYLDKEIPKVELVDIKRKLVYSFSKITFLDQ